MEETVTKFADQMERHLGEDDRLRMADAFGEAKGWLSAFALLAPAQPGSYLPHQILSYCNISENA